MSDFAAMGLLIGLGMVATFCYWFFARSTMDLGNTIVTGVVSGVPISIEHRQSLFDRWWLVYSGALVGYQSIVTLGWMLMAGSMEVEEVRLFTYLCAFFGATGTLALLALLAHRAQAEHRIARY